MWKKHSSDKKNLVARHSSSGRFGFTKSDKTRPSKSKAVYQSPASMEASSVMPELQPLNMTAGFVCAAYVRVGVLTLVFFFLLPLFSPCSLDPRQTEGASLHRGTLSPLLPPHSFPAVLMVGLWGTSSKGTKEAKLERKSFDLFYRTESRNFRGQVLK